MIISILLLKNLLAPLPGGQRPHFLVQYYIQNLLHYILIFLSNLNPYCT